MTLREYLDELDSNHIKDYTIYLHIGEIGIVYASISPRDLIERWLDYHVANEEISGYFRVGHFNIDVELEG